MPEAELQHALDRLTEAGLLFRQGVPPQRHWPVPLHSLQLPIAMPAIDRLPLPPQRVQQVVLWPWHLGHRNLFGIRCLTQSCAALRSPSATTDMAHRKLKSHRCGTNPRYKMCAGAERPRTFDLSSPKQSETAVVRSSNLRKGIGMSANQKRTCATNTGTVKRADGDRLTHYVRGDGHVPRRLRGALLMPCPRGRD